MPPLPSVAAPATRPLTQAAIRDIIAQNDQPILRNLRITQCYGDLSRAIAATVGDANVNWCTFATWASRTAGKFIRLENINVLLGAALNQAPGYADWVKLVREKLADVNAGPDFGHATVITAAEGIATDVSADIAAGNLLVFSELAPVFGLMVESFNAPDGKTPAALERVLAGVKPGNTSQGGQDMLRHAVADYHAAMRETEPKRKAELMLRANAQIGAHEQMRLQPYIEKSMDAPLADGVAALVHRSRPGDPAKTDPHGLHRLVDWMLHPFFTSVEHAWLEVSTHFLMTLELPNGTLRLGRDLPHAPGQADFPADLAQVNDAELLRILRIFKADGLTTAGCGAKEWQNFSDRMRYILELFRARQQDATLFEPPFGDGAAAQIARGQVPLAGI